MSETTTEAVLLDKRTNLVKALPGWHQTVAFAAPAAAASNGGQCERLMYVLRTSFFCNAALDALLALIGQPAADRTAGQAGQSVGVGLDK